MHPTKYSHKTIYPNLRGVSLRTNEIYLKQADESEENIKKVKENGIKGTTYISNWLNIPEFVMLDYMHLSIIGLFKRILNDLFDSANYQQEFYLGKKHKSLINTKINYNFKY